jgi:drug/metabolite transporter (DMT)-like permease
LKPKHWFAFILLAAVWSSSFLWIKIAVQELSPFLLVALRTLFGALVGILAILITRTPLPRQRSVWIALAVLGLANVAVPFVLISWGEQTIDSAVASILNATVPLFTFLIANLFLRDERLTPPRILGLITGFVGVIILLIKDLQPGLHNSILGQAAVLLAAVFYAGSMVYARLKTDRVPGLVRGILPLVSATTLMWTGTALLENPIRLPSLPLTWLAVIWLGVLGSGLAFILWYYLLQEIGPTRAALVTYTMPLGGVLLGVIFLKEPLSWNLALGGLLIVISVIMVNRKKIPSQ